MLLDNAHSIPRMPKAVREYEACQTTHKKIDSTQRSCSQNPTQFFANCLRRENAEEYNQNLQIKIWNSVILWNKFTSC